MRVGVGGAAEVLEVEALEGVLAKVEGRVVLGTKRLAEERGWLLAGEKEEVGEGSWEWDG